MAGEGERILVIGGRSKIGSALIGELLERGRKVVALTRGAGEQSAMPEGVEAVAGDLADPGSLALAMRGVRKVFLLSSPHRDAVRWHSNAIAAARQEGVGLLVRSSILGADHPSRRSSSRRTWRATGN